MKGRHLRKKPVRPGLFIKQPDAPISDRQTDTDGASLDPVLVPREVPAEVWPDSYWAVPRKRPS